MNSEAIQTYKIGAPITQNPQLEHIEDIGPLALTPSNESYLVVAHAKLRCVPVDVILTSTHQTDGLIALLSIPLRLTPPSVRTQISIARGADRLSSVTNRLMWSMLKRSGLRGSRIFTVNTALVDPIG